MTSRKQLKGIAAGICLALLAGAAQAADTALEVNDGNGGDAPVPTSVSSILLQQQPVYWVAASDAATTTESNGTVKTESNAAVNKPEQEVKDPFFTLNKTHKYLGLSTIAAALVTMFTAPGEGCEQNCAPNQQRNIHGTHANMAKATVALAGATIFTGVLAHWDDVHLENGITDPDNLHVLAGLTGTALMAYAVNKSMSQSTGQVSHAGIAEIGALIMAVGIKLVW
jgi:hypothetical protein